MGLKLIQSNLKDFKIKTTNSTLDGEIATDIDVAIIDEDYRKHLKIENERLWDELKEKNLQLKDKDLQIHELHKLVENSQVLLKEKPEDIKLLEQHFQKLDEKIMNIKERSVSRQKGFFKRVFKK